MEFDKNNLFPKIWVLYKSFERCSTQKIGQNMLNRLKLKVKKTKFKAIDLEICGKIWLGGNFSPSWEKEIWLKKMS